MYIRVMIQIILDLERKIIQIKFECGFNCRSHAHIYIHTDSGIRVAIFEI